MFTLNHPAPPLPFRTLTPAVPPSFAARFEPGADAVHRVWQLDFQRLDHNEQAWLQSGEYSPHIAFHWLNLAAGLLAFSRDRQCSAAIYYCRGGRLIPLVSDVMYPLAIDELLTAMGSGVWLADAQVALVWGFAHRLYTRRPLFGKIACRGLCYPCTDGLNTGWWAAPQDVAAIIPLDDNALFS